MDLVRLIYASRSIENLGKDDVDDILSKAKKNNGEMSVSGVLCYDNKFFLQLLEGSSEAVNQIYHRISKDPRHNDLRILGFSHIDQREFDNWDMKLFMANKENQKNVKKYSTSERFDPYRMKASSAFLFLKDIVGK